MERDMLLLHINHMEKQSFPQALSHSGGLLHTIVCFWVLEQGRLDPEIQHPSHNTLGDH